MLDQASYELWRQVLDRQVDTLRDKIDAMDQRIELAEKRIDTIHDNTAEAVTILRDWKGAMAVLKFTAKFVAPIGAIITTVAAVIAAFKAF
jgi:hypothetical protein